MTLQADLIRVNEQIAAKQTRLKFYFDGADALTGNAAMERSKTIKSANDELTTLVDERDRLSSEVTVQNLERDAVKAGHASTGRQIIPTNDDFDYPTGGYLGRKSTEPRSAFPDLAPAVFKSLDASGAATGMKALVAGGAAYVEIPIGGPVANPYRARFIEDLLPTEDAPGGRFNFLQQSTRTNNAAAVAEGALKPTSVYTLTLVEGVTDVIAHLSESLPKFMFTDAPKIKQFLHNEMALGVRLATDAQIVTDLFAAGILVEGDIGSAITTCRRALTRIEERELDVTNLAYIFHPRDWEQVENEAQTTFAANSNMPAPTSGAVARSLFGVPVITSMALTENTGLLGDFGGSAVLHVTGGIQIDWSDGNGGFQKNEIVWRAERRAKLAITRPFAFVSINLAATGS